MKRPDTSTGARRTGARRVWRGAVALLLLLTLGGCGSDNKSNNGNGTGVTVNISPAAVAMTLNQTQAFAVSVTGVTTVSIAATNGAVRAANVVTITTTAAHNLTANQTVTISGVSNTTFNGTYTVASVPSSTTFTYAQFGVDASSGNGSIANTSVRWFVNDVEGGNTTVGTVTTAGVYTAPAALPPTATATITANGAVRSLNVVTITTAAAHNFVANQIVQIAGVTDTSFNGAFVVSSAPSSTTFTYSQTGSNATSGSGTASSTAVRVRAQSVVDTNASATAIISLESGVTVRVTPQSGRIATGENFAFTAVVTGNPNQGVNWLVNDIAGGNSTVGTISAAGVYTAPGTLPNPVTATITAGGAVRSGNVVTITTTAAHSFVIGNSVQISGVTDASFNGIFTVSTTPSTTTFTYSQSGSNATSGGGTASTATTTITIKAVSVVDVNKSATASVVVTLAADPTLTSISPTAAPQGAALVDVYLTGTGYLSTTIVRANGTSVPSTYISGSLLRARIPESLLSTAGTVQIDVQRQNGTASPSQALTVAPVRPALVSTSPDSAKQDVAAALSVNFNGGYYSGSVTSEFNGQTRAAQITSSRLLNVALSPGDLSQAGLFAVGVRNSAASPSLAAVNVAVQPSALPAVVNTVAVGTAPAAVAVNHATGVAVVANRGSNSITRIDLATFAPSGPLRVGTAPTGVAVDHLRNVAVVANNGSDNFSIVDLASGTVTSTLASPPPSGSTTPLKPFAVAINPLTGLAIVANQSTNTATVLDLTANPPTVAGTISNVSTGPNPQVAVEPSLNWGIITPGGAGAITIVDLSRRSVVATVTAGVGVRGIGINTETQRALMVDPSASSALLFSVLDQTVSSVSLDLGYVAAAVNSLTDTGVAVNSTTNQARVIDLRTPLASSPITVGTTPRAVAIDPTRNLAVIVNEGSNDATILNLGAIRALHVTDISPISVLRTAGSSTDLTLTVTGSGFDGTSVVRLDGTPVATTLVSGGRLTAVVPAAMLASARRYSVDVLNAGPVPSNVAGLTVIQAVTVGDAPRAVAIDEQRNVAVVANSGSDNISVVDLNTGMVTSTITVGDNPQGVALIPRLNRAVVTNRGSSNASLVDLAGGTVSTTVTVGTEPLGVAINQDTAIAVVANYGATSMHAFEAATGQSLTSLTLEAQPFAVAIDPSRNLAAITHAGPSSNNIVLVSLYPAPALTGRVSGAQLPTGITYDPVTDRFLTVSSLANNLMVINPDTREVTPARVGINPTSVAYNFNSSTLVTVNSASRTLSVMDFLERRVRAVLPISAAQQFAVAIHPLSNLAVVADDANDRVLLVPLPR